MGLQTIVANDHNTYDVVIVGGGPAALTAAIYLRRANLKVCFIEKNVPGGKMVDTVKIGNFPGFDMIHGADLALKMYEHATKIGAEYIYGNVNSLGKNDRYHVVYTDDGAYRLGKAVIIAVGTTNNVLGAKGEQEYRNKGISYCAICDGTFAKDKPVVVAGGGESAVSNTIYLSGICSKVYLVNKNSKVKTIEDSLDVLKKTPNVEIIENSIVAEVKGDGNHINKVIVRDENTKNEREIEAHYLFVYAGSKPSTIFLEKDGILNSDATIKVDANMKTSVDGVYAIGDVNKISMRQITTAASDGTIAAIAISKYLKEQWK